MRITLMKAGLVVAVRSAPTAATEDGGEKEIVQTATAAGSFETLAAGLRAADLVDALQGDGLFTVFAPTDAFGKLPAETLESPMQPESKAELAGIPRYHVVSGSLKAADVVSRDGLSTLNGQRLGISASDAGVRVDSARVVTTDIASINGVIHVIDSVILPASDDVPTVVGTAGSFSTLPGRPDEYATAATTTVFGRTQSAACAD